MYFTIDADNNITTYDTMPPAQNGIVTFRTEEQFTKATADWPISRLVETWNGFAGVAGPFADLKPVKKFENRTKATNRIWLAIKKLEAAAGQALSAALKAPAKTAAPKTAAKKAAPASTDTKPAPREDTAKAKVIALIERKGGATLQEIMAATNWQPHTVRGFISTLPKKTGLKITSIRRESDKARVYEVAR